jgi:hypothetical protein
VSRLPRVNELDLELKLELDLDLELHLPLLRVNELEHLLLVEVLLQ